MARARKRTLIATPYRVTTARRRFETRSLLADRTYKRNSRLGSPFIIGKTSVATSRARATISGHFPIARATVPPAIFLFGQSLLCSPYTRTLFERRDLYRSLLNRSAD